MLHLQLLQFLRSYVAECRLQPCRSSGLEQCPQPASRSLYSPGSFQAGAPTGAARLKWPAQSALDRNRSPKSDSFGLLQLRRHLADEILDILGLMAVANQNCVARPHHDQIMHAEQRDRRLAVIKNNVVTGIERG